MTEASRGLRFQALLVEECAKVDQEKLTEIIMPMLVVSRKVNNKTDPHEVLNQSAVFVTSAGFKSSYSYEKLINTLCMMVARPEEAFIFGGSWKIPVIEGLQPENYIQLQEQDTSMDEEGFAREYLSQWSGSVAGAFYNPDQFDKCRTLAKAHWKRQSAGNGSFYVLGVDVGRVGCSTEVIVMRVRPSNDKSRMANKDVVNIYTLEDTHFAVQALAIKKIFEQYKCEACVLDGNGLTK